MAASDVESSISTILLKDSRLWTVYSSLVQPPAEGGGGSLYTGYCTVRRWFWLKRKNSEKNFKQGGIGQLFPPLQISDSQKFS